MLSQCINVAVDNAMVSCLWVGGCVLKGLFPYIPAVWGHSEECTLVQNKFHNLLALFEVKPIYYWFTYFKPQRRVLAWVGLVLTLWLGGVSEEFISPCSGILISCICQLAKLPISNPDWHSIVMCVLFLNL